MNGTGGAGHGTNGNRLYIYNNIFRSTPGEAIELRMSDTGANLTNAYISGNAFHDIGKGTCSVLWKCRSAITFSTEGGGSFTLPIVVSNNLIWDTGENCVRAWDNPTGTKFYNNTCYNWGVGTPANGAYSSAAFADYSFTSSVPGDFRNNVIYATGNDANSNAKTPFPNNASIDSYNACSSTTSCGTNKQTVSATDFISLDENNIDFLKITSGDSPYQNGTDLTADVPNDYLGQTRSAPVSIGAMEVEAATPETPMGSASFTYFREWMLVVGLLGLLLSAMLVNPGRKWGDA